LVLLGPFTVAYICLLLPRALYSVIYDRYLLGLLPIAIFALLKLYERESCRTIPRFAYIPLLAMATYAVIATHDLFALDRARVAAAQEVISSGIPAREVQAGFDFDGLTQIESSGYVNFPTIQVPTTAYKQDLRYLKRPAECRSEYDQYFSALNPKYRVAFPGSRCGEPTPFKPVQYRTWLSPTHRRLEIVRVATGGN
jgi:hypothetical protein